MLIRLPAVLATVAASLLIASKITAAPISVPLTGNTSTDGWANITSASNPSYPGFPGSAPWPSPIGSNTVGSGDADLNKISGSAYPGDTSLYSGGFSETPNLSGAVLAVSDATVPLDLKTVVFQIEIGAAFGYDFYNGVLPTLSYNGGSQNITATYTAILSQVQTGTFPNPITGLDEPIYVTLYGLQWDLSGIQTAINSIQVSWTTVQHSQVYALQLDQSDTFTQVIPEPSTYLLLGLSIFAFILLRGRFSARPQNN